MRRQLISLYSVLGVVGGVIGLVSAIVWYSRTKNTATGEFTSQMAGLGPLLLGLFSLVILILAAISVVALLASAKEDLEE